MALTSPSMSPAIVVREFDLTGVAPNVETSLSAFVGRFKWGPVDVPTRISNETKLAETFGVPDASHAVDYYSCNQFLRYSGNLIINRQIPVGANIVDSALNAHGRWGFNGAQDHVLVKNEKHFEDQTLNLNFVAKYPGAIGNSLKVSYFGVAQTRDSALGPLVADSTGSANHLNNFLNWTYQDNFDAVTGTSEWASNQPGTVLNDEIHMVVVDSDGLISGTKGTVLETFPFLSVAPSAKTVDGGDNYVKTVINNASNYVWFEGWDSTSAHGTSWGQDPNANGAGVNYADGWQWSNDSATVSLSGGQDHDALDVGDYQLAFDNFQDVEEVDVQMMICPGMSSQTDQVSVVNHVTAICGTTRKDCLAVASPNRAAVVNQNDPVTNTLATTNRFSASSYLAVDNNYLRVYDKYNDNYIYIPAASTTAGIMALTDFEYGPWWSPAGERRGEYVGVTNLAYSPNKAERDELYKKGVNPIVQFPGRGTLLFGDKTKLSRPSAFDRINVRRLFLAIEKSVAEAARNFLFEFNDEFTRSEFVAIVEPLLREIQARRGIQDFFVQCDERNNTPEVIDRNELIASIFIKPARSINFITINFVATRTGADFEEIIQSGIQF
jgi:phage tail sheath protein FI